MNLWNVTVGAIHMQNMRAWVSIFNDYGIPIYWLDLGHEIEASIRLACETQAFTVGHKREPYGRPWARYGL